MPGNFSFVIPNKLAGCAKPGGWGDPRSDLAGLSRLGIGAIVSLTEERLDAAAVRDTGFRYLHLPVADFSPPSRTQIRDFVAFVDAALADDVAVAVHCGAGMGRTGTMLACYLVSMGQTSAEAIRNIRSQRPGSIETAEQERCIADYQKSLKTKNRKK